MARPLKPPPSYGEWLKENMDRAQARLEAATEALRLCTVSYQEWVKANPTPIEAEANKVDDGPRETKKVK